jgi:predicted  nucleic acid-binding Zn-ribbon protein
MELNKTIQDLKMEVETIKKTPSETTVEIETLGKKSRNIDMSISNRIHEIEERISGAEDSIGIWAQQSKKMQNAKRS